LAQSPLEGYFHFVSIFRGDEKHRLLSGDLRNSLNGYDTIEVFRQYYERADGPDPLSRILYLDIKTYLTDDILAKVDRASMAVSLEVRAPLLDHKLMDLVATMPAGLKLRGTNGKYILKKALEPMLPSDILYRRKQGFSIPLHQWFRRELKELAQEALFSAKDGVLDAAYVRKIWEQHQKSHFDRSAYLWAVLMFRTWQKTFSVGA
jgi:asparagine synthase (glutamine-hydrolysing)